MVIAVFQSIFTAATPLMDGIDALIGASGQWLAATLPNSWIKDLLIEGVWAGVGSVVIFLPQILILFLFIGVLEDSGYLARAAVIADRTMSKIGLQGKSFIPLLSAYACAVPAIMATRTIESKRDRIATILIAPFMTCSARLPVYTLVIAAFLPEHRLLGPVSGYARRGHDRPLRDRIRRRGLHGLDAQVVGVALDAIACRSCSRCRPIGCRRCSSLGLRLYDRSRVFLRRAGTVILATTIILWCLASVPLHNGAPPPIGDSLAGTIGRTIEPVDPATGFQLEDRHRPDHLAGRARSDRRHTRHDLRNGKRRRRLAQSARSPATGSHLRRRGRAADLFAFALQCMSTVAIVRRETGGWKWPVIQFLYMLAMAYCGALAANQLLSI